MKRNAARIRDLEATAQTWHARARNQAARADRLDDVLYEIHRALETLTLVSEQQDDRESCERCGRRGWPEEGFTAYPDDGYPSSGGQVWLCPEHDDA